jgi:hypothetical protein
MRFAFPSAALPDDDASAPCEGTPCVGVVGTPLRRLTRRQYDNTVRDLLGVDVSGTTRWFTDDSRAGPFSANLHAVTASRCCSRRTFFTTLRKRRTQWLRFALRRPDHSGDQDELERLTAGFVASETNTGELMVAVVATHAFRYRPVQGVGGER